MQPSYNPITTYVKASPVQRFIAAFIDSLVGAIPFLIFTSISYRLTIIGQIVIIGYFLTKDALPATGGFLGGQSIGKKLMNIKVIKEATGASLLGDYGTSIIRQVSLMIPLFGFVDALMVFSSNGQRFGDQWAKTIVIKV